MYILVKLVKSDWGEKQAGKHDLSFEKKVQSSWICFPLRHYMVRLAFTQLSM